jgi:NAD(P)-dependent dehydrogenase (short-subunit alcohol dehydrogenase family)
MEDSELKMETKCYDANEYGYLYGLNKKIPDEEFEKVVIPLIPMGKLIQPEDIAETILFLASEQAKMITGQVIKVSGGKAISG